MKKGFLIFLMSIVSFLGINTVSADTSASYYLINENFSYEENLSFFTTYKDILSKLYDGIYEDYLANYSDIYPYYHIAFDSSAGNLTESEDKAIYVYMYMYSSVPTIDISSNGTRNILPEYATEYKYYTSSSSYILPIKEIESTSIYSSNGIFDIYYFYSNFDLILNENITITTKPGEKTFSFSSGDIYPVAQDLFDLNIISDPNGSNSNYIEINLNNYPYVALSLKDYNNIPPNNSSVYTNIWTKGQLCITPVYNYGMTERKDILTGTQIQRCSSYFNDFTITRMYLLKTDVENHAIYYLKAYDTTRDNIIKVDTSIFDISYITEDTKDNPYVNIIGKQYPTIAYDKLTDTATKSEDEDYNSGVSCPVGDFNCYNDYNSENIFDSIFDSPLKILKNIWSSITSVFDIITEFIMLLPETMQSFLFLSFMIAIILGLIKIIL